MDEKVSQTHIIILALMYNYISNRDDFLERCKIDNFVNLINLELYKEGKNKLISYEDEPQNIYYYDSSNKTVYLSDQDYFLSDAINYINAIPKDIILTSLKDDILRVLNVDKDEIKLVSWYEHYNGFIDVFALSECDALKKAKDCLNSYGYKSIKTHMAYPEQKYGDKSYHVRVSYDVEKIFFATGLNDKKFVKNTNQNQV